MSNFLVGRGLNDAAYDVFSGTGAQTVFSLTSASSTSAATVSISGVVQRPVTDYSVAGTTLTFVAAPPSGTNNILVQYNKSITIGTPADGTITTAKIADDAVTLAKMAGGTDGNLITFDANGDPAYVATGTAAQVLTSNGAGAAPTFQDAAGGAWNFISETVVSGAVAAVSFPTVFLDNTAYDQFIFELIDFSGDTNGGELFMQVTDDSGVSYEAGTQYEHATGKVQQPSGINSTGVAGDDGMRLNNANDNHGSDVDKSHCYTVKAHNPKSINVHRCFTWDGVQFGNNAASDNAIRQFGGGSFDPTANALTGAQFYYHSGNVDAGTVRVYGLAKA